MCIILSAERDVRSRSLGPRRPDKVARQATPLGKKLSPGGYSTNTRFRRGISPGEISTRGIPLGGILTHNTPPNRISVPVAALWVIRHMCTGACGCAVADVRYVGNGALDAQALPEFVLNHGDAFPVGLGQDVVEQGCFTCLGGSGRGWGGWSEGPKPKP